MADAGHILENVVCLEPLRRGYEVYVVKVGAAEVDFEPSEARAKSITR